MAALGIPQAVDVFRPVVQLVQAGLFLSLLLTVSIFDLKLRLIPDRMNLAIALTALLVFTPGNLFGVLGALPYLLVLLASRNEDGMGGGDVKLAERLAGQKRDVALVLCGMTAPMLPCICPPRDLEGEHSLGSILAATHVSDSLVRHNCITHKRYGHLTIAPYWTCAIEGLPPL